MPGLKFKSKSPALSGDFRRSGRLAFRLNKLSESRRREQLQAQKKEGRPLSRGLTKVTIKGKLVNRNGGQTGVHMMRNPPSSEHMKKVRAMRKIYNRAMPVLQCSTCAFSTSCPQFKAGFECAYLPYTNSHSIESEADLLEAMKNLCSASMSRVHRSALMETLTGGMPSLETSEAMNIAFMQMKQLHDTLMDNNSAEISVETEDGTIIGRLFGGLENLIEHTTESHANPIEVVPVSAMLPGSSPVTDQSQVNRELIKEHTRDELETAIGSPQQKRKQPDRMPAITLGKLLNR